MTRCASPLAESGRGGRHRMITGIRRGTDVGIADKALQKLVDMAGIGINDVDKLDFAALLAGIVAALEDSEIEQVGIVDPGSLARPAPQPA